MTELINKNYLADDETFLRELFYKGIFNLDYYLTLQNNIANYIVASEKEIMGQHEDNIEKILFIYSKFSNSIINHLSEDDIFTIKDYNRNILIFLNRLFFLLERMLDLDIESLKDYEDEKGKIIMGNV